MMELEAMKAGKRQRDEDLINELWQKNLALGQASEAANELYEAYQVFGGMIESFKGLHDASEMVKRVNQLALSHMVKVARREELQQIRRQREIESQIDQRRLERKQRRSLTTAVVCAQSLRICKSPRKLIRIPVSEELLGECWQLFHTALRTRANPAGDGEAFPRSPEEI